MNSKCPMKELNSGYSVPMIGLGTWKSLPGKVASAVEEAISCGYRHIDCALVYENESEVGDGVAAKISDGTVTREELFITSKVWCTYHSTERVKEGLLKTLSDLKLSYIDLYLMHWPFGLKEGDVLFPVDENGVTLFSDIDFLETWKAMEKAVADGLVRSIGLSNFNKSQIEKILSACSIKPAVNQVECHPFLNQQNLIDFCFSKSIAVTAYSPLGSPARPFATAEEPILMENKKLVLLAKKYGKLVSQILLRYQFQRRVIAIPKSVTKERIRSNFQIFDFELSQDDMDLMATLNIDMRYIAVLKYGKHPFYPFHDAY